MGKIIVSTLANINFQAGRRVGNTTRQIDEAVQLLFAGFIVKCEDHHEDGKNHDSNVRLYNLIIKRLITEHHYFARNPESIKIDYKKCTIELV